MPKCVPKGARTKKITESEFGTGSKFATEVAKRYREGSEGGRKTVQVLKNYGGCKILRIRAP